MLPIVEWHTHVIPPEDTRDPHWRGKCPLTIENVIEAHHKADIALSVVTDSIHQLQDYNEAQALDALKGWHDRAAALQEKYRGKVVCFASTVPTGGDAFDRDGDGGRRSRALWQRRAAAHLVEAARDPTRQRPAGERDGPRQDFRRQRAEADEP